MNELQVTVAGWVATDVKLSVSRNGASIASFRLASTPRYFDRAREAWVDGATEWFTVRTFRGAAILIARSIEKGQPVVVAGRMRSSTWKANDGMRTDLVIEATAVGHDCTRGVATFVRATGTEAAGDGTAAGEAIAAAREAEAGASEAEESEAGAAAEAPDPVDASHFESIFEEDAPEEFDGEEEAEEEPAEAGQPALR